jgi:hypothetical protein
MKRMGASIAAGLMAAWMCAAPATANQDGEGNDDTLGEGRQRESRALPPPQSHSDPRPPVPAPARPNATGITRQAGVGGTQSYARAGVLELGGAAGFSAADNYTRFQLAPSIGYFIVDNVQLSLLGQWNYFRVGGVNGNGRTSATELAALVEPSYHLPFNNWAFGFLGVGAGLSYLTDADVGFAFQPRIGANFLVGRSGILTPSFNVRYSTTDALRTEVGTLLAVSTTYGLNIGYTVMW